MTRANTADVRYGPPDTGKKAASRSMSGRHCEVMGCVTLLSTYNAATTCWLHSAPSYRHALAPR
jgi:hypothetical protein